MSRPLTGDRCVCAACGLKFASTYAHDRHRVGTFKPLNRHCLSVAELRTKGWSPNDLGFWRKPAPAGAFAERRNRSTTA
jgi:hypothetical protein